MGIQRRGICTCRYTRHFCIIHKMKSTTGKPCLLLFSKTVLNKFPSTKYILNIVTAFSYKDLLSYMYIAHTKRYSEVHAILRSTSPLIDRHYGKETYCSCVLVTTFSVYSTKHTCLVIGCWPNLYTNTHPINTAVYSLALIIGKQCLY